jgi:hypothetical protein
MVSERPLDGLRIGMALHVEAKTGMLAVALSEAGAKVRLASCNPLSTDDSVSLALRDHYGLEVYAKKWETTEEYYRNLNSVLDLKPDFLIDDGADLITMVHTERKDLINKVKGASEETTTGVVRLRSMAKNGKLKFPVISVNEVPLRQPIWDGPIDFRRLDDCDESACCWEEARCCRLWLVRTRDRHAGKGVGSAGDRGRGEFRQGDRSPNGRIRGHADDESG